MMFKTYILYQIIFSIVCPVQILQGQIDSTTNSDNKVDFIQHSDSLIIQGIPPVPIDIARSVKKYNEAIPVKLTTWHPSENQLIVRKRSGNATQIHLVTSPLSSLRQLTSFTDPVTTSIFSPLNDNYFLFLKAAGGNEVNQLFRYDLSTKKVVRVTQDDNRRIGLGIWSKTGLSYIYTAVMTGKKMKSDKFETEIRIVNPNKHNSDSLLVKLQGVGWRPTDWSPTDNIVLLERFISANESNLWLLDTQTGIKRLITKNRGNLSVINRNGKFSKDGKSIYYISDKDSEFQRLIHTNLDNKTSTILSSHVNWDLFGFKISHDKKFIAFDTNENGLWKLRVLDNKTLKEVQLPKLPEGQIGSYEWH
ncbi:MAG: hypothetical protein WBA74_12050, partial [Cyclobacteriaceae bacterium]